MELGKMESQIIYFFKSNCGDSNISKTVLQHTALVDLFVKEVVNAGY